MEDDSLLARLGFSNNDLDKKVMSLPKNPHLSEKLGFVFHYNKSEQVKTRFYWIKINNISNNELKSIHERIWNENKSDLLFIEKSDCIEIKYIGTSPKQELFEIATIPTNNSDNILLERISKEHLSSGAFWIEYYDALERIKKQRKTVDQALVESLSALRSKLDNIYITLIPQKTDRNNVVQALIDRTLFIKFLEDKKIINSEFYNKYFNNRELHYKNILEQKDAKSLNILFYKINEVFNNKLFATPEILDSDLIDDALTEIANAISGTKNGQLCLFDFQFDIIPIEFISHIYQIFLDDKKAIHGIFYTPEGLASLLINEVISNPGTILDPSCGSGIFLVLAFRKMYHQPKEIQDTYQKIQHRLKFIQNNIFGIEIENTAARLAVFSLYLEVLNDIETHELNHLITSIIQENNNKALFSIDFSENIQEGNALTEGVLSPFFNKEFDYIIGNPPWFKINKNNEEDNNIEIDINNKINYQYWNNYRDLFSRERQISQCFLHRINSWAKVDTKFGFIVNSSNFINESEKFQHYFFSKYKIRKIFELYHIKEILFDYAKEPASLVIFSSQNNSTQNTIEYYSPKLNSFAETFKTILLKQEDVVYINQKDLITQKTRMRDFLIGNINELELANKLENDYSSIKEIVAVGKNHDSYRGFEDWGEDALKKEYGLSRKKLSKEEYAKYKEEFYDKYFSKVKTKEHCIQFVKSSHLSNFTLEKTHVYCIEDISNFHRPRNSNIYTGSKILCSRVGGQIKAVYSEEKIYFASDIYVLKLLNAELYHVITCCLNSMLLNFYSEIKLRKRIDSALSRLDAPDLLKLPLPKKYNTQIVEKLNTISLGINDNRFTYEDREDEINELVFDLYELSKIERQRVADFFISKKNSKISSGTFIKYCQVFYKTIQMYLKNSSISMDYFYNPNLPIDIAGVKLNFSPNPSTPRINEVPLSVNYQLLKQIGNSVFISLNERIYSSDGIFIIKDTNPRSWTKSAAYDDARVEIGKLFKR